MRRLPWKAKNHIQLHLRFVRSLLPHVKVCQVGDYQHPEDGQLNSNENVATFIERTVTLNASSVDNKATQNIRILKANERNSVNRVN